MRIPVRSVGSGSGAHLSECKPGWSPSRFRVEALTAPSFHMIAGIPSSLPKIPNSSPPSEGSSKLDFAVDRDAVEERLDLFGWQQRIPSDGQVAVDVLKAFEPG